MSGLTIREVDAAHQFTSRSTSRDGYNTYRAGCTCDPSLEFDWRERGAQHREHLHAAIFDAARDAALAPIEALARDLTDLEVERWNAYMNGPGGKTEELRLGEYEATEDAKRRLLAAIRDARGGAS